MSDAKTIPHFNGFILACQAVVRSKGMSSSQVVNHFDALPRDLTEDDFVKLITILTGLESVQVPNLISLLASISKRLSPPDADAPAAK